MRHLTDRADWGEFRDQNAEHTGTSPLAGDDCQGGMAAKQNSAMTWGGERPWLHTPANSH